MLYKILNIANIILNLVVVAGIIKTYRSFQKSSNAYLILKEFQNIENLCNQKIRIATKYDLTVLKNLLKYNRILQDIIPMLDITCDKWDYDAILCEITYLRQYFLK